MSAVLTPLHFDALTLALSHRERETLQHVSSFDSLSRLRERVRVRENYNASACVCSFSSTNISPARNPGATFGLGNSTYSRACCT